MNTQKLFLLFVIISLILISCTKEENVANNDDTSTTNNTPHSSYSIWKVDSNLYPYIFKSSSYWIYQNDSLFKDTVSLYDIQYIYEGLMPLGPGQGPRGEVRYFVAKYISSIFGEHEEHTVLNYISLYKDSGPKLFIGSKKIGDGGTGGEIIDTMPHLTIANKTYNNITLMRTFDPQYFSNNNYHSILLYYADSIGIIKKEIFQNDSIKTTWNLIEYNVNVLDRTEREALKPTYN